MQLEILLNETKSSIIEGLIIVYEVRQSEMWLFARQAAEQLYRLTDFAPTSILIWLRATEAYLHLKDTDEALSIIRKALERIGVDNNSLLTVQKAIESSYTEGLLAIAATSTKFFDDVVGRVGQDRKVWVHDIAPSLWIYPSH